MLVYIDLDLVSHHMYDDVVGKGSVTSTEVVNYVLAYSYDETNDLEGIVFVSSAVIILVLITTIVERKENWYYNYVVYINFNHADNVYIFTLVDNFFYLIHIIIIRIILGIEILEIRQIR